MRGCRYAKRSLEKANNTALGGELKRGSRPPAVASAIDSPPSAAVSFASVSVSKMRPAVLTSARPLTKPPDAAEPASGESGSGGQ